MRAKLSNWWENALSSFWFLPAVMTAIGLLLAQVLPRLEAAAPDLSAALPWLGVESADAARSLLSVVASSLITVVAIAFSVTIVALQQASTQYTPRVLRNFSSDRGNQVVLGMYIATFTYALLVMHQVRDPTAAAQGFVPTLSTAMAIVFALASLGLLIYFIHHVTQELQASSILASLRGEVEAELNTLFPSHFGSAGEEPPDAEQLLEQLDDARRGQECAVRSDRAGYLRRVDEAQLTALATTQAHLVAVRPRIGDFVQLGAELARVWSEAPLSEDELQRMREAFVLDRERSLYQDPLFGIREMVDIGVKALSPAINDPTTAEQCLAYLGDVVAQLAGRDFPTPLRRAHGTRYLFNRPSFSDFVEASFSQLRRAASQHPQVTLYLLSVFLQLADRVPNHERAAPFLFQVAEVLSAVEDVGFTEADRHAVREKAGQVKAALARPIPQEHLPPAKS